MSFLTSNFHQLEKLFTWNLDRQNFFILRTTHDVGTPQHIIALDEDNTDSKIMTDSNMVLQSDQVERALLFYGRVVLINKTIILFDFNNERKMDQAITPILKHYGVLNIENPYDFLLYRLNASNQWIPLSLFFKEGYQHGNDLIQEDDILYPNKMIMNPAPPRVTIEEVVDDELQTTVYQKEIPLPIDIINDLWTNSRPKQKRAQQEAEEADEAKDNEAMENEEQQEEDQVKNEENANGPKTKKRKVDIQQIIKQTCLETFRQQHELGQLQIKEQHSKLQKFDALWKLVKSMQAQAQAH